MNKRNLAKFRKLLEQEKVAVQQHLTDLKNSSAQHLEIGPGDEVDLASTEITQAALQKLGNRERKHLGKVDYALQKIDSGEYGTCEMCGEDIAVARLEARPIALFCIDCKTDQEQKERQFVDVEERDDEAWTSGGSEETVE